MIDPLWRAPIGAVAWAAFSLYATQARADDEGKAACFAAHEQGQILRNGGKLREARASFLKCGVETCPALAKKDCIAWAEEVAAAQPTIVVESKDARGRDTADVRVFVDGALVADRTSGSSLEVDPGEHTFRFEAAGERPIEQHVVVLKGEKDRRLRVAFAANATARPPLAPVRERAPVPTAAWVLGGLSIASLGLFAGFAIGGKTLEKSLASSCVSRCSPDDVAPVKRDYAVADVALGVAAAAAIATTALVLTRGSRPVATARGLGLIVDF